MNRERTAPPTCTSIAPTYFIILQGILSMTTCSRQATRSFEYVLQVLKSTLDNNRLHRMKAIQVTQVNTVTVENANMRHRARHQPD